MKRFAFAAAAAIAATSAVAMEAVDLDIDGDGFASRAEISQTLGNVTASDFNALDSNNDNRLSANELSADGARAIVARYEAAPSTVVGVAKLDGNNDGFASFTELRVEYPGLTAADFNDIDLNNDNRVSFNELYNPVSQTVLSRFETGVAPTVGLAVIDANGDDFGSYAELVAVYPGLSAIDFQDIDANNDLRVSFGELYTLESQTILGRSGS